MGKLSLIVIVLVSVFITIGCENSSNPLIANNQNNSSFDSNSSGTLSKSGSGDGAMIIKYKDEYYTWFRDYDAGYTLIIGVDIIDFCIDGDDGEEFDFTEIYLPNTDPDEKARIIRKISGNNKIASVWTYIDETTRGCDYYLNTDPIAVGTVKYRSTDNDLDMSGTDRKNANSWRHKANGNVYGPNGEKYKLNAIYRGVWKTPYDPETAKREVKIQLTKQGKK